MRLLERVALSELMQKFLSRFEKILFYITGFLFVFIVLFPKLPILNVRGTFVAVRPEDILIALSVAFLAVYLLASKQLKSFFSDKVIQSFLLFFFVGLLSVFAGILLTATVKPTLGLLHFFRRVEVMMLLPLGYYAFRNKVNIRGFAWIALITVFLVNIYAFGQQYLNWPVISTTNSEFSKGLILHLSPGARVNSTFAGHYDLAVFLMMFLIVSMPIIFVIKSWWLRSVLIINMIISFVVLVMTAARFSFVALIAGVVLAIVLTGRKLLIAGIILLSILSVVVPSPLQDRLVSTVKVFVTQDGAKYTPDSDFKQTRSQLNIPTLPAPEATLSAEDRATPSGVASDITPGEPTDYTELTVYRSFGIRFNYEWPAALRAFYKNPILGTGYSSLGIATDNDFLRSLGEVGLLGTFSLGLVFYLILKKAWTKVKSGSRLARNLSIGAFATILAFLLNGLFIDVLESSKIASLFWLFIGIYLARVEK